MAQATQLKHNTFQPKEATRSAHSARPTCASAPCSARTSSGALARRQAMAGSVKCPKENRIHSRMQLCIRYGWFLYRGGNSAPRATDRAVSVLIGNGYTFAIICFAYTTNCVIITVEKLSNPLSIRNCDGAGASIAIHQAKQLCTMLTSLRSSLHLFCCILCCILFCLYLLCALVRVSSK